MSIPSTDELKGKWQQQVGAAKIAWGKLTEDELLKSEGHAQKLAGLVQERQQVAQAAQQAVAADRPHQPLPGRSSSPATMRPSS